jgi:hypothetical protein
MQYFPTLDLTPQVRMLLGEGALRLQPGQWVKDRQHGVGRYLRTDLRSGTSYISWVRPEDDWKAQSERFHRACIKGFVGKYAPLYEMVRLARKADQHHQQSVTPQGMLP